MLQIRGEKFQGDQRRVWFREKKGSSELILTANAFDPRHQLRQRWVAWQGRLVAEAACSVHDGRVASR